jgi:signal peptidase I
VLDPLSPEVLIALALRLFVIEAFHVPSGSMMPTILPGDHLFVQKPGLGRTRLLEERGEPIVFQLPDPAGHYLAQDFVKRVVGVPGDVIEVTGGHPRINGWQLPTCDVGRMSFPGATPLEPASSGELWLEFLDGHAYLVFVDEAADVGAQGPYTVRPGELWVLGDNRNNSFDSRHWNAGRGGGVPLANVKGRAWLIWLPSERFGVTLGGVPRLPPEASALAPELASCLARAPSAAQTVPPRGRGRH